MRICIISNGIHRHTQIIADGLVERGHKVYLVYIERNDPFKPSYVKMISVSPPKRFSVYRRMIKLSRILKSLKDKVDVGIFVGYPMAHILLCSPDMWVKVLMPITHPPKFRGLRRAYYALYEKLIEKAIDRADVIVNDSNYMAKVFSERYGKKSIVIPPPVDEKFKPDLSKKKDGLILNVAKFRPQRGQHKAIELFKKLNHAGINVKLVLHGIIREKAYFQLITDLAKKVKGVHIVLHESDDKLINLYQSATVFWWPITAPEAFGMPPAEAMSCGTPVIAFDQEPIREIIDNGKSGFVANNELEFIEYTTLILTDKETREEMYEYCIEYAKRFSKKKVLDRWERLLSSFDN